MATLMKRDPFEDIFRGFFVRPVEFGAADFDAPTMKVDVKESPEVYTMHAELPGIRKEDIHVQVDGANVSISAERMQEKEEKTGERVLRSERHFGKVSRTFQLGTDVDEGRAMARFRDGVLELTLPKKAAPAMRRLTID